MRNRSMVLRLSFPADLLNVIQETRNLLKSEGTAAHIATDITIDITINITSYALFGNDLREKDFRKVSSLPRGYDEEPILSLYFLGLKG
jgi:hypothetical protein